MTRNGTCAILKEKQKGDMMSKKTKELEAGDVDEYGYILIEERDALKRYDEYLNEYGDAVIGSLKYRASRVLREVDPVAYRCGFDDWADAEQLAII